MRYSPCSKEVVSCMIPSRFMPDILVTILVFSVHSNTIKAKRPSSGGQVKTTGICQAST